MIDPTAPSVLDVHDFRRAGDFKRLQRTIPAPSGVANPVLEIPAGADVETALMLESVIDGVLVTAEVTFPTSGVCSRCLEPLADSSSTTFSELYLWEEPAELGSDDEPLPVVAAGLIDLSTALRDAIVLAMPLAPVCAEDCLGLCSTCGIRLADDPDHHHEVFDERWAALAHLQTPPEVTDESAMGDT